MCVCGSVCVLLKRAKDVGWEAKGMSMSARQKDVKCRSGLKQLKSHFISTRWDVSLGIFPMFLWSVWSNEDCVSFLASFNSISTVHIPQEAKNIWLTKGSAIQENKA